MFARIVSIVVAALLVLAVVPAQGQTSGDVTFTEQLRQFLMNGDKTTKVDITVTFTDDALTLTPKKRGRDPIVIPYAAISHAVYDRRSRMRKMMHTAPKAEDHFLTVQFKRPDGTGDFVEFEMGKRSAPRVIATLEARSGQRVERASGS
jgi:hypothetical protein